MLEHLAPLLNLAPLSEAGLRRRRSRERQELFFLHCRDEILPPINVYLLANDPDAKKDNVRRQIEEARPAFRTVNNR